MNQIMNQATRRIAQEAVKLEAASDRKLGNIAQLPRMTARRNAAQFERAFRAGQRRRRNAPLGEGES